MIAYCFVSKPNSWGAYACALFQAGSAMVMVVVMQSYVSKRTPKNIRGMIFAVIGCMCAIGSIVYLQVYGALMRAYYWPPWAFATIALIDVVMLMFLFLMIMLGKFGNPPEGTDEDQLQQTIYGTGAVLDANELQ